MKKFCNVPVEKYLTQIFNKNERVILFENYKIKELFAAFLYIGPSVSWRQVNIPKSVFTVNEWKELNRRRLKLGAKPLNDNLR